MDRLIAGVRTGHSGVVVLCGEAGLGKTALLEYVSKRASGCRIARAAGVESEMELAFAGLHQLCAPMLGRLDRLPAPQRDALGTAFGLRAGDAPDRFLVGLGALTLLSDAAETQPVVCLVDDAQWLDQASRQALAFVARRLLAESIALVFATRSVIDDLRRLPELWIERLSDPDARALLGEALSTPLDAAVREAIVAETRGNPLALLELPRGLAPDELAGGFRFLDALPYGTRLEGIFRRRLEALPGETQRLLLVAAAEPTGDPTLLWRAAEELGVGFDAAGPAAADGLFEIRTRATFRHPVVRSAIYRAASASDRMSAHVALAEATDPEIDPDRRAWHRAQATPGPDAQVAAELERSADRARRRGGVAAAAAFLERAAELTPNHTGAAHGPSPPPKRSSTRARPTAPTSYSPRPPRARSTTSNAHGWSGCGAGWPPPGAAATPRRCCLRPPSGSNRWTQRWLERPTSTRSRPASMPASWPRAAAGGGLPRPLGLLHPGRYRPDRWTCCSMVWQSA